MVEGMVTEAFQNIAMKSGIKPSAFNIEKFGNKEYDKKSTLSLSSQEGESFRFSKRKDYSRGYGESEDWEFGYSGELGFANIECNFNPDSNECSGQLKGEFDFNPSEFKP